MLSTLPTLRSKGARACMMQTFKEADLAGDGHISPEEWQILVNKNPTLINYMTLPMLKDLTKTYPSFCFAKR